MDESGIDEDDEDVDGHGEDKHSNAHREFDSFDKMSSGKDGDIGSGDVVVERQSTDDEADE